MRTAFVSVDGEPRQKILAEVPFQLIERDLSALAEDERDGEVQRAAAELAREPYDLSAPPLFRVSTLKLGPQRHVLLLAMHHIVSDGWSMGVLTRELSECYASFARGRRPELAELPIQYADFAVWQRSWLQGEALASRLAWWTEQLGGLPVLELPTDRPRPRQLGAGSEWTHRISAELVERLRVLSRQQGATLFMTLLAGFQALLRRYTGQTDFAVGTPLAGRTRVELEGLVGFFVNTLVLRSDLAGDPHFSELVDRVRDRTLDAYARQEVPFERIVEALQPRRDPSRTPLFQVLFALQNTPEEHFEAADLRLTPLALPTTTSRFDVELLISEDGDELSATWMYSTDLFDQATIARMADHYLRILGAAVVEPDRRLSQLPVTLLDSGEQSQVESWSGTAAALQDRACLHELVAARAARAPDALALSMPGHELTFGALDARANQLAHVLMREGIGPEAVVALHLDRSIDAVVALLAILKAGAAYVPLPADQPRDRQRFILDDTGAALLLSEEHLLADWRPLDIKVMCLDVERERIAAAADSCPESQVGPNSLAYIIYTSGSTGRPKGVMVEHHSLHHLWNSLRPTVCGADMRPLRISLNAPLSFDASLQQLVQLIGGHTLCPIPAEVRRDGGALIDYIIEQRLDVLDCTPSHLRILLDAGLVERLGDRRLRLIIGGEALDQATWDTLARSLPDQAFNVYGPTECTVDSTVCPVNGSASPILGRSLAHAAVYVLDEQMRLVPPGIPGEVYIGGNGLARGYLGRRELTAERFVPNPFAAQPGQRLYRTGDRARWRRDGQLEFLGRLDRQVKVRGYRIELGEIEAALDRDPAVREVVVICREVKSGDHRLFAYVTAQLGHELNIDALRAVARDHLPAYMIPTAFVTLDEMPLNQSGKIDHKALPEPRAVSQVGEDGRMAPRTPTEVLLAEIWSEVLLASQISVHDDFFELGGHSLLATQVLARMHSIFAVELPLRVLFEAPVLGELAERVEVARLSDQASAAPPLRRQERGALVPQSFAQERLWFLAQLEPDGTKYNTIAGVRIDGDLNLEVLSRSFGHLVDRH
ncbi:MAG: amino acid adenylation domain-containing protein, partial [Myxococcota bacterium]